MLLETSTDAVNSALRRARAARRWHRPRPAPSEPSADDRELLAAYIDAFERHDVDGPRRPAPRRRHRRDAAVRLWLRGADDIRAWLIAVDAFGRPQLTPVNANGSPAVAVYRPREAAGGQPTAFAIHVLDVVDGRISAIHSFLDPALFELFGLPLERAD